MSGRRFNDPFSRVFFRDGLDSNLFKYCFWFRQPFKSTLVFEFTNLLLLASLACDLRGTCSTSPGMPL